MFIQVVQAKTTDPEGVVRQTNKWNDEVRPGAKGFLGSTGGVADDGTMIAVVRFADEAAAKANSERPEQSAWFNEMEKYLTDVSFRDTSDTEEPMGPGSDKAGFVQVMQGRVTDRARLKELEAQFMSEMAKTRPDVIGSVRAWFGDDYVEAIYFSSEAEARQGEQTMGGQADPTFEEFMSLMPNPTFVDLKNPILHSA
ncbi:MAG: hypothetical protein QOI61_701 [Actinomycetota bacterium]|jgi:hypothetical protein